MSEKDSQAKRANAEKTEVIQLSVNPHCDPVSVSVAGQSSVQSTKEAKCLGVWWRSNGGADKSVSENIIKSRKAFFAAGAIGAYQGELNPLSSRSIYLTCVSPVLLYGSENWILNDSNISDLEVFQAQMGKKMLRLSRFHANVLPSLALHLPSVKVQVLIRKLKFLARLLCSVEPSSLGPSTFRHLAILNVDEICLIQQCRWLETTFLRTTASEMKSITDSCLLDPPRAISIVADAEPLLLEQEVLTRETVLVHPSLRHVHDISNWLRVWDMALDRGPAGTVAVQKVLRFLTEPLFGERECKRCHRAIAPELSYADHLIGCISLRALSADQLCDSLNTVDDSIFVISKLLVV